MNDYIYPFVKYYVFIVGIGTTSPSKARVICVRLIDIQGFEYVTAVFRFNYYPTLSVYWERKCHWEAPNLEIDYYSITAPSDSINIYRQIFHEIGVHLYDTKYKKPFKVQKSCLTSTHILLSFRSISIYTHDLANVKHLRSEFESHCKCGWSDDDLCMCESLCLELLNRKY
jgi:hypothetical protein